MSLLRDSKGQSFVVQFIMFFMIGMGLFILLGNFYRYESENIKRQLIDYSTEMIGSYMSSMVVSAVEGCPNCGVVEYDIRLAKTYAGHFIEMDMSHIGLSVRSAPKASEYTSSLNNLFQGLNIIEGSASSVHNVNLTYDKDYNILYMAPSGVEAELVSYGFNTHMYATGAYNLDLDTFKQNANAILANGHSWVRFSMNDWEVAPPPGPLSWDYNSLDKFDQAIDYADDIGLKVFLVTNVPTWASGYALDDYKTLTRDYYTFLADRYKGEVDVWQVFNEPNAHHFRDYGPVVMDAAYLNDFNEVLAEARTAIKQKDPGAIVTTSVGGYPYDQALHDEWKQFFDSTSSKLDLLTLDVYPDDDQSIIDALKDRTDDIKRRYRKSVFIGETGMCTGDGRFTEAEQGSYVSAYIEEFKKSLPITILVYEIQDDDYKTDNCESSFGLKNADGSTKSSYSVVLGAMN